MKFRETAALGLSTLMFCGNTLLPYASASTISMSSQTENHQQMLELVALQNGHHLLTLTHESHTPTEVLHPVQAKSNVFHKLNPLTLIKGSKTLKTAKSVSIQKKHAAQPVATVVRPTHSKVFLEPLIAINTQIPTTQQQGLKNSQPLALNETAPVKQTSTASKTISYTQIFTDMVKATQEIPVRFVEKVNPVFETIFATSAPPRKKIASARPKVQPSHEIFQMLAASPLDQLVLQSKGLNMNYAPGLDTTSPDITTDRDGTIKVLKSGISQKVTSVDLPIGKAEVMYLSRPASRVSVSNPDVASAVIISPTQIQLVGKAVGVANLLVWGDLSSPDHTIVDINVHRDVSVLVNQLKYVDSGIQIVPMAAEDTVILTGQAESRESAQLAIEMAKAFFTKGANAIGGAANGNGPNSQAPGSATPGMSANVINLIKVKGEPSTKLELVRQRLHEIDPNVHIEVVPGPDGNEKVILTGRVASSSIVSKALNLTSIFYGQPGVKVVTAQGGNDFVRMRIVNASASSSGSSGSSGSGGSGGSGGAGGSWTGNVLQGSVLTDATGNVISMLEIAQKPQIRCSIKFLELNKSGLSALGGTLTGVRGNFKFANWSGVQSTAPGRSISTLSTQTPPGSNFGTANSRGATGNGWTPAAQTFGQTFNEIYQNGITQVFSINNTLAGAIQALQENQQVRTLAEPTLMMLSGEQGSFLAGGEIPIAFVGGQGQISVEYHEFGIRLNLLPNVTDDGKIQMQVAPEVSAIDQANGVSTNSISVPAFTSRRMNTTLLVEPGQSFVLAGLYSQQDTDSLSRFPGLGSVPVLGSFFRNKWKNRRGNEIVVIVKPEIVYSSTGVSGTQPPQTSEIPVSLKSELSRK